MIKLTLLNILYLFYYFLFYFTEQNEEKSIRFMYLLTIVSHKIFTNILIIENNLKNKDIHCFYTYYPEYNLKDP